MESRLKELRKELKLTQTSMAEELHLASNYIYLLESGKNPITDKVIMLICTTFRVNETWLRTGEGDMFQPMDRAAEIARITKRLLTAEDDDFLYRLIKVLSNLDDDQLEVLKGIGEQIVAESKESHS